MARKLAAECLMETELGGFSNLVFKQRSERANLDERDTAFAASIFYGTLERQYTIDKILSECSKKDLSKLDAEVRAVLRSGLYQCRWMNSVPIHASVSQSVELCRKMRKSSAAGFVNAVLRRAAHFDLEHLIAGADSEVKRLALRYSAAPSLAELLCAQYGEKDAEVILRGSLQPHPTTLCVNTVKCSVQQLVQQLKSEGVETEEASIPNYLNVTGPFIKTRSFRDGLFHVQSIAAAHAVLALDPQPGESVLDLCAAPGGKTMTAAVRMKNKGRIFAADRSKTRLELVQQQAVRLGFDIVKTQVSDSGQGIKGTFDRVLCDVPCSGLGELSAKPELRSRPRFWEPKLRTVQMRILEAGANAVRKGGRLVYSTCTIDKRENEEVVFAFLSSHKDFCLEDTASITGKEGGMLKFLPGFDGSEGFFVATFERM